MVCSACWIMCLHWFLKKMIISGIFLSLSVTVFCGISQVREDHVMCNSAKIVMCLWCICDVFVMYLWCVCLQAAENMIILQIINQHVNFQGECGLVKCHWLTGQCRLVESVNTNDCLTGQCRLVESVNTNDCLTRQCRLVESVNSNDCLTGQCRHLQLVKTVTVLSYTQRSVLRFQVSKNCSYLHIQCNNLRNYCSIPILDLFTGMIWADSMVIL